MTSRAALSRTQSAADPLAALDLGTKQYIDARINAAVIASSPITPSDQGRWGDLFASVGRPVATSQDTLSTGFHSFTGGPAPQAGVATKLRWHCRAVAPAGAIITFALHKGASTTVLPKQGADIVVTGSFNTVAYKQITIPSLSWNAGDFLYLSMLRTGTGTPDPAMATTGGPASPDLYNPDSTHFVAGFKSGQSVIPATLDTSAAFTGSGRMFWWSLAA